MSLIKEVPHVTEAYEKDNKFYLRSFLIDDSIAKNGMGIDPSYLPKHIHKFVGSPVILTERLYHPHEFDHYKGTHDAKIDVPELKKLQEPYIIGKIVSVDTNSNIRQGGNTNYSSILEITDGKAIEAFRRGKIPLYVSPSIYVVNNKDPIHSITDYEPLHIAIVNNPAYGFHKANIRAQCSGDKDHCSLMLAQAGLPCREKQLESLQNVYQGSISNSSLLENLQTKDSIMSSDTTSTEQAPQQKQEVQQPVTEEQNKQETVIEQKVKEQLQAHTQQQEQKKTPIGTPTASAPEPSNINPPGTEEQREGPEEEEETAETPCAKAQREYETKLAELENDIKEFKEFKSNFEKTAAETKLQSKRSRIESMVPLNYANSEEERTKAVESLMKVEDEQLEVILNSFVIPATRNIRQGGMRPRAKVTDFVKPLANENKNVAQAGIAQRIDFEELDKILSFGYGGIVPKKNNEGGIA